MVNGSRPHADKERPRSHWQRRRQGWRACWVAVIALALGLAAIPGLESAPGDATSPVQTMSEELARRGMDKFLGQWADYIKLETDFFLAQAHSHMAEEDASTFRAAHQRLHLQEACAVLNRVFAASNASKGGGKLLKLHRPNLLASVTALKTKLAALDDQFVRGECRCHGGDGSRVYDAALDGHVPWMTPG